MSFVPLCKLLCPFVNLFMLVFACVRSCFFVCTYVNLFALISAFVPVCPLVSTCVHFLGLRLAADDSKKRECAIHYY